MKSYIKLFIVGLLIAAVSMFTVSYAGVETGLAVGASMAFGGSLIPNGSFGAITLGQGFAPYLLAQLKNIVPGSTPMMKMESAGFVNLLQRSAKPDILRLNNASGHRKSVSVSAKRRFTKDFVEDTKSCDRTNQQSRYEIDVDLSVTKQIAIHIPDETIAKYEEDASRTVAVGQPSTSIMNEMLSDIMSATNAIIEAVDEDLLTLAVAEIGVNRVTGNANTRTLNLNQDTNNNQLNDGITEMLRDYQRNQATGRPSIVGSGNLHAFAIQQAFKGLAQNGIDTRIQAQTYDFYYDENANDLLGANQAIVYEPNAVQVVEYMEYTGFKAGVKPDGSTFFILTLPLEMDGKIVPIEFDAQLKYNSCAENVTDAYYGTSLTLEKGWNLIISKQCGLFTIPDNAYRGTDPLNGNRGSYRYTFTNNCETC